MHQLIMTKKYEIEAYGIGIKVIFDWYKYFKGAPIPRGRHHFLKSFL